MKKILFATLAIAALTACTNDNVLDTNPGDVIKFGNAFVDNATKADPSYSAKDITSVTVYGTVNAGQGDIVIYPGTEVTKGTAAYGVAWTCPVDQYWIDGASYEFVGIVDGNKSGVTATTLASGMPTSISYTSDGVTDLLCQTITRQNDKSIVAFDFDHLLAKLKFTVENSNTEATNYINVVKNIKVTAPAQNTYNVATAAWGEATGSKEIPFAEVTATEDSQESENEKLILPATSVKVAFDVNLYYVNGDTKSLVSTTHYDKVAAVDGGFVAGNAYNLVVEVGVGQLIQFTVEKQPEWTEGTVPTVQ